MEKIETIFTGSGVAMITPFALNNSIDYKKLKQLIEFQINNKTDAIIIAGTTGEASTLTDKEHLKVVDVATECINGRIPLIVGTGSNDTSHCIWLSKKVVELGVDGLLLVTPYYNKTSQNGLIAHYTTIADKVFDTPILLYNVPSRTGMTIELETYQKLDEVPNIVGTKEASGNLKLIKEIIESTDLDVYSGNDDQITVIMSLGGKGVISVMANIIPEETHILTCDKSVEMQEYYNSLIRELFPKDNPNPIAIKEAMNILGMDVGLIRLPLIYRSVENQQVLKDTLDKYPEIQKIKKLKF